MRSLVCYSKHKQVTQACTASNPMDHTTVLNAITNELVAWQADGKDAPDALVRIAEILHDTGRLADRLPDFYARRDACDVD